MRMKDRNYTEEVYMKTRALRIYLVILFAFLLLCGTVSAEQASGTAGDLNWTLSDTGVLTISGTGEMTESPWRSEYADQINSVVIKKGVTSIGTQAFIYCTALTSVSIPDTVTQIGNSAFYGCTAIKKVTIPTGVKYIFQYAFERSGLTGIKIPGSVEYISWCAFEDCENLESVEFADGLCSMDEYAFSGCNLKSVSLPSTLNHIGYGAFYENSNLTTITVSGDNPYFSSKNGVLYTKNKDEVVVVPGGKSGKLVFPDTVKSIRRRACSGCAGLTEIILPDGLEYVGADAFSYCDGITQMVIPSGVKTIENSTFMCCTNLKKVVLPDGLTEINDYAFDECHALTEINIPSGVTKIGSFAFNYCEGIKSFVIPAGVTKMPLDMLSYCTSLESVTIPSGVTEIGSMVFTRSDNLKTVYFCQTSAPEFSSRALEGASFTAYYPSSWAEAPTAQYYNSTITWTKASVPVITAEPKNATVIEGQNARFSADATGEGLSYQWEVSTDGGTNWKNSGMTGSKTSELTVEATAARNGYQFRVKVTDCVGQSVTSKAAGLTVAGGDLSFDIQPASASVNENKTVSFNVNASSKSGSAISYRWQVSEDGGKTWKDSGLSGNKTATLKVTATLSRNGYRFRCVATNAKGDSLKSTAVKLTVKQVIKINSQAVSQTVTKAENVKFRASAASLIKSKLSYQWQVSTDGGSTWKNSGLSGNKTAVLTVGASKARSGYRFRCVISDEKGNKVITQAAVLTVSPSGTSGKVSVSHMTAGQSAEKGTTVIFNVLGKTSTGTALTYQWQVSTDAGKTWKNSSLSGNATATLKVEATESRNGYRFRCIIKDAKKNSFTTDAAKLTVK